MSLSPRFIQAAFGLALLALTQCEKPAAKPPPGAAPDAGRAETEAPAKPAPVAGGSSSNSVALVSEGLSPAFRAVVSRLTQKQMLEKLDARAGVFLRLDPAQKFKPSPEMPPIPGADAVIVVDRLGWLVEALKPQFMPMLQNPGAPVAVSDNGGVLMLRFKSPAGPPPMDFQPVLRFDPKADRILFATRPALFDAVVAGKEKITQDAKFTQAWRDLPTEGNACLYASPRLLQTVSDLIAAGVQEAGKTSQADRVFIGKIFDWIKPHLSRGQALVLANQPDGIVFVANTSIQANPGFSTVATLAGFALPVFASAQEKGRQADDVNKLKQLTVALKMHALQNDGKYPPALSDLVKSGLLTNGSFVEFTDHKTKQRQPWLYRNSLTEKSRPTEPLLAAPVAWQDGRRAVAFNDGSVRIVTEAEFQQLWGQ